MEMIGPIAGLMVIWIVASQSRLVYLRFGFWKIMTTIGTTMSRMISQIWEAMTTLTERSLNVMLT